MFITQFGSVFQVTKIFKGGPINVKLRSVGENMLNNSEHKSTNDNLTLNDLVKNLNDDERLILDTYFDLYAPKGDND